MEPSLPPPPIDWTPRSVLTLPRLPPVLARNLPWILLILCSITFAEFLTGSTPVLVPLVDPLSAAFLIGLYGAGVILGREAAVRWNRGWPTVLLLGAAYGIVEEGIGTKTFFGQAGVGYLAVYGHFAGVNWVWAVELALFHAVWSIALPIVVVGLVFPGTRGVPFLPTPRSRWTVLAVFVATVAAMFALFNRPETPSVFLLLAALAVIAALVYAARNVSPSLAGLGFGRASLGSGVPAFVLGAAFVWGFFGLAWVGPRLIAIPAFVALAILGWCVAFGVHIARRRERFAEPLPRLDFVLGCLSFLLVLATAFGAFGDYGALPVVAIVVVVFWRLRRHLAAPVPPPAPWGATSGFPS
jgi:hypothetical protein